MTAAGETQPGMDARLPVPAVERLTLRSHLLDLCAAASRRMVKGDAGHVVVLGGSQRYGPPPYVAGLAALRAGADSARIIAPDNPAACCAAAIDLHVMPSGARELDASAVGNVARTCRALVEQIAAVRAGGRVVLLVGPGLGGSPDTAAVLDALVDARPGLDVDVVIDGSLGGGAPGMRRIGALAPSILLLNQREAASLIPGWSPSSTQAIGPLPLVARGTGATVVVKGAVDVIATADSVGTCGRGHPALAKNGTGDVLAGVVAGLLAQRVTGIAAAAVGCHAVGAAGECLAESVGAGFLPSELVTEIAHQLRTMLAHAPTAGGRHGAAPATNAKGTP